MLRAFNFTLVKILGCSSTACFSRSSSEKAAAARWPDDAGAVVVGGGVVGCSVAYHLAKRGVRDVVLLEKSELTAGSTWHAAGLTALFNAGINMKKVHYYSLNLYSQLEAETGQPLGFHRPGSLRLATTPARMDEFRYQMQRQGWNPAPQHIVDPDFIYKSFPLLNMNGILGGLYNPSDGHIDPYSLTMALAAGARKHGATLHLRTPVEALRPRADGGWEVDTPDGQLRTQRLILAAGFWGLEVGKMVGLDLPMVPVQHQYLITKPIKEVEALEVEPPVFRHLEGSFYLRAERGGLLVGPYEAKDKMNVIEDWASNGVPPGFGKELFQPNLDRLTYNLEVAMDLVPLIRTADVHTVVNGPIMYTPDLLPMLGPLHGLPNVWAALGFSYGIAHSGGCGKYLADWIVDGEPPHDLTETDPNRFGSWTTRQYVVAKTRETYGMNNSIIYPKEERQAGRPTVRLSGAHEQMLRRGAHMDIHAGWEQPAWFALDGDEKGYKPSFRRTNWFEPMQRECRLVMNKAGIIDLTPFAKIDVKGKDAAIFIDKLLANKLPKVGKMNISHMLTPKGKVYAEITVTRLSDDHFFLVTGSGSEIHDLRWMQEYANLWKSNVEFKNLTEEVGCLSIAGPLSRKILSKLTTQDLENKAFPFLSAKEIDVAGLKVLAIRVSYTGELGFELHHPRTSTATLYEALLQAGASEGVGDFGTRALDCLRVEKGFRLWGAEMNMDTNPYEAGLDAFIALEKPTEFVGRPALRSILSDGLKRRLVHLRVDVADVDPEGNEAVWCCDRVVGHTTSGGFGATVGFGVAMAYLPPVLAVPNTPIQVELLGELRDATVLPGPPLRTARERDSK